MKIEYTKDSYAREAREVADLVDDAVDANAEYAQYLQADVTPWRVAELTEIVGWLVNKCADAGILTPEEIGEQLCAYGASDFRAISEDR